MIHDAPANVDAVDVSFTQVSAHGASGWLVVSQSPQTVDLIALQNGVFAALGLATLPPGHYDQVRLDVSGATITVGGQTSALAIPSGKESGLKIVTSFDVLACGTTTLSLDWNVGAHLEHDANGYALRPVLDVDAVTLPGCAPPPSCQAILAAHPGDADGVYKIQPPGASAPFDAYCDMTRDGGGWTLMATLHTTDVLAANSNATSVWGSWSDDWFALDHGANTDPSQPFTNIDARKLAGLVSSTTVLRIDADAAVPARYHTGFGAGDWALWNASRTVNGANVVGPFDVGNVVVSRSADLSNAVPALVNGHWSNGAFLLGCAPNGGGADSEGIADRYWVGTDQSGQPGYAGDQRIDTAWRMWVR